jgi:hypothetical protein
MTMMTDEVKLELVETDFDRRLPRRAARQAWTCIVCKRAPKRRTVVAVAEPTSFGMYGVCVCGDCLKDASNIDMLLDAQAMVLEHRAKGLRGLIGRLDLPSYADWMAQVDKVWQRRLSQVQAESECAPAANLPLVSKP